MTKNSKGTSFLHNGIYYAHRKFYDTGLVNSPSSSLTRLGCDMLFLGHSRVEKCILELSFAPPPMACILKGFTFVIYDCNDSAIFYKTIVIYYHG